MTIDEARVKIREFARRHAMGEIDAAAMMLAVVVTSLQVATDQCEASERREADDDKSEVH